ncbi:DinB superfamily protein [Halobacillus karajensis]|uniref:DinB superfamily protein n=1 Tax=Halobacillus karajensis TaxID=195088 RepID=A0A024P8K5_9BACI|nr:DinB family protein [Halobacillus karajensis]CDQ20161.1 DinB superfamily protein [Halobacillus karajensis]CDQ25178.1 DinB superfamily protein [Halobacillus karajensis]CDQ28461.1 DinB superfamily protein [Halobacillus karajensis]SEI01414.1 DinB superfamily protein [Halobacillus karajensis]
MNEEQIFKQINMIRQATLKEMDGVTEEQADKQPEGFKNTIRWNLGHIYVVQNSLMAKFGGKPMETPSRYLKLFAPGTKPSDWQSDVPSLDELKQKLEEQPAKLKETLNGQLDDEAAEAFLSLPTVGEILNFTLYHEGVHTGTIKALKANMAE